MQINPSQIRAGLHHADPIVRQVCRQWFQDRTSSFPIQLDDLKRVLEIGGLEEVSRLPVETCDEVLLDWVLEQIRKDDFDQHDWETVSKFIGWLNKVDVEILKRRNAEVEELVSPWDPFGEIRDNTAERCAKWELGPAACWEEFLLRAVTRDEVFFTSDREYVDFMVTEAALREVISSRPDVYGSECALQLEKAIANGGDLYTTPMIELATQLRWKQAAPMLVRLLGSEDNESFMEIESYLAAVACPEVIEACLTEWPGRNYGILLSTLHAFKASYSDEVAIHIRSIVEDDVERDIRVAYASGLALQFRQEDVDFLDQYYMATRLDYRAIEIADCLYTYNILAEANDPRADNWKDARDYVAKARERELNKARVKAEFSRLAAEKQGSHFRFDSIHEEPDQPIESSTIRTSVESRVGRNDACPCGSGLKYKKCCLRNKVLPAE